VSWQEALGSVARALEAAKAAHGAESIGFLGSQKASNEDIYMFQRLAREGVGTNNIDHRDGGVFPASLIPGTGIALEEIERTRTVVLFAFDARAEAPLVWLRAHHAHFNGAKLIVIDERGSEADAFADQVIRYRPGSEVLFLKSLTALLGSTGLSAEMAVGAGVPADEVAQLASTLKDGFVLLAGPRVTAKADGADIVRALWALVDSQTGASFGLMHSNNNTRGAYDLGAVPDHAPGWLPVPRPGMTTTQMLHAAVEGRIQVLYLMGDDPLTNYPDAALVNKALNAVPFLVVQDILKSGLTERANVVLPALTFAEREGTFTNLEGRVQFFTKAVDPIGGGRADWEICAALLQAMGVSPGAKCTDDVTRQIASTVPEYQSALPGALPPDGILVEERRPEAHTASPTAHPPAEGSAALPLILLTGDVLFDNGPLTRDTAAFAELEPAPWVDVSERDAANAGILDGDTVTVASEFGVVDLTARVGNKVAAGTVFVPNKVAGFRVNTLMGVIRGVQRVRIARKAV
jgi:predicted molibdopterin-dependent oxidoreductase YjgC